MINKRRIPSKASIEGSFKELALKMVKRYKIPISDAYEYTATLDKEDLQKIKRMGFDAYFDQLEKLGGK